MNRQEIAECFDRGVREGSTHLIIACDSFDHEDYPVFVQKGGDVRGKVEAIGGASMQRVMEVYDLSMDRDTQLNESRAYHVPAMFKRCEWKAPRRGGVAYCTRELGHHGHHDIQIRTTADADAEIVRLEGTSNA
jgi:hypothetical protein